MRQHPCLSCGACCAAFRVAFHWAETEPALGGPTPAGLTARLDAHRVAMLGTFAAPIRCVALRGEVGTDAACSIYPQRPSVCRELLPAWEAGLPSPQCDRARERHGLAPLRPDDWLVDIGIAPAVAIRPAGEPTAPLAGRAGPRRPLPAPAIRSPWKQDGAIDPSPDVMAEPTPG